MLRIYAYLIMKEVICSVQSEWEVIHSYRWDVFISQCWKLKVLTLHDFKNKTCFLWCTLLLIRAGRMPVCTTYDQLYCNLHVIFRNIIHIYTQLWLSPSDHVRKNKTLYITIIGFMHAMFLWRVSVRCETTLDGQ